ncbi:MAG: nucleotide exchange factor GrpE [Pseudomonadota bacterium]
MAGDQQNGSKHGQYTGDDVGNRLDESASMDQSENGNSLELDERIQEAVNQALAEQRDSVLRAHAEMQNMRRRCEADVEKAHKFALEKFSAALLPIMDNLERALAAVPDSASEQVKGLSEGVELTLKSFLETLTRFNIVQLNPLGEPFDPQMHQAITTLNNPNVVPNTVIEVMQKGYSLHGRVIRPAMVVVAKGG